MFVNCPFCRGLVATDPVTDQPPERCPRCSAPLRETPGATATAGNDARSGVAAAMAEAFGTRGDAAEGRVAAPDPAPQPIISIANLLQPGPATVVPATPPPVVVTASPVEATSTATPTPPAPAAAEESGLPADAVPSAGPLAAPADAAAPGAPAAAAVQAAPAPPGTATGPSDAAARPRRATPSFARSRRVHAAVAASGRRWPLPAAIAALAVLLALQWLLADRARLAADPSWRPVVATACGFLRCSLPPWHEPTAFVLLERDVRPHPDADGALRITASFRNDAAWDQPWPEVVLTLSDVDNRPLGTRAFQPAEYLGSVPPVALLGSGEGAVIRMDVLEPGPGAVGFSFDFR